MRLEGGKKIYISLEKQAQKIWSLFPENMLHMQKERLELTKLFNSNI